jgi:hypothetical protein
LVWQDRKNAGSHGGGLPKKVLTMAMLGLEEPEVNAS